MQCVIFSELLSFINVMVYNVVSNKSKLYLAIGGYTVSIMYVFLSIIISILFSMFFYNAQKIYIIIFVILTSLSAIATILIYIFGRNNAADNSQSETSNKAFKELEYKIELICLNNNNPEYVEIFKKIWESIKSCDQSSYVDTDSEINKHLQMLDLQLNIRDEESDEKIYNICEMILILINKRRIEVSKLKLGGV